MRSQMYNGTKDGSPDAYVNPATGESNINPPKPIRIRVTDMRTQSPAPTLERDGFMLAKHTSSLTPEQFLASETPDGKKAIQHIYFSEIRELLTCLTGSPHVYPHQFKARREAKQEPLGPDGQPDLYDRDGAVPVAHLDRDAVTAPQRLRENFGAEAASALLSRHRGGYALCNVWRPAGGAGARVARWPLCLVGHAGVPGWTCESHTADLRRVREDDGDDGDRRKHHDSILVHDDRYTYHYASNMGPDDVLIFFSFCSDPARAVPHGAFWDDSSPADAPPRLSNETRSWIFFD
ncbi:hypothetical protein GGR56DRAFT_685143 [Xylariaceae sp. FL0804]|nr:hypothetical protein GGR56DRAFT_685143 [Xylariaceae sp. FL0804]